MKFYHISSFVESCIYYEVNIDSIKDISHIEIDHFGNEVEVCYEDLIGKQLFETVEQLIDYHKDRLKKIIAHFKERIVIFEEALDKPMQKIQ